MGFDWRGEVDVVFTSIGNVASTSEPSFTKQVVEWASKRIWFVKVFYDGCGVCSRVRINTGADIGIDKTNPKLKCDMLL